MARGGRGAALRGRGGDRRRDRCCAWRRVNAGRRSTSTSRDALTRRRSASAPPLVCFAGHDAGVIAERRPAGMVLVRNPTGMSHAPEEEVDARRRGRRGDARCSPPSERLARDAPARAPRHAERALARVPARPSRDAASASAPARPTPATTSGAGARRCTRWPAGSTRTRCAHVGERVYAEMAAAGYGAVGEFHYVHHRPDGTPVRGPERDGGRARRGGRGAGLVIVLLPAAYHRAGWDGGDLPPAPGQRRFCDPSVEAFLERVDALREWAAGRERTSRSASPPTACARCRPAG